MANTSILLKRTSISGRVPKGEDLGVGELAINLADGILFSKQGNGNVITVSSGGSGVKGEKGDKGDAGATGDKGDKGEIGDKGDKGDVEAQGNKGDKGDSGSFGVTLDSFTGDGSNTSFTLSTSPIDEDHTIVMVQGIFQSKNAYSISNNTIIFSSAPANNNVIEVTTLSGGASGAKGDKGDKGVDGIIGVNGDKGDKGEPGVSTVGAAYADYGLLSEPASSLLNYGSL